MLENSSTELKLPSHQNAGARSFSASIIQQEQYGSESYITAEDCRKKSAPFRKIICVVSSCAGYEATSGLASPMTMRRLALTTRNGNTLHFQH